MALPNLFNRLAWALDSAATLLTPPRCRVCRAPLWGCDNALLCPDCLAGVEWIGPGACALCGYPAGPYAVHSPNGCSRCRSRPLGLTGVAAVARYGGGARQLVRTLKFGGERMVVDSLAGLMAERWRGSPFFGKADLVVPLSLHPARLQRRGFDQAKLLGESVARELGLEYGENFVRRTRFTVPQAVLHREERLRNMDGVFAVGEEIAGRRVVLVDDVMTTGATIAACAGACRQAGALRVYGLCFAR